MTSKIRSSLKDRRGFSFPLTVALLLALIMLLAVISEAMRLQIIAQGVRDALQSAVIATVNDNYNDIYHGAREGYAGGYQPGDTGFDMSIDYGDVFSRLDTLLGLTPDGGQHRKYLENGAMEYALYGLNVNVRNAPLAPSEPESAQKFTAEAKITLNAPVSFGGLSLPPLTMDLKVKAGWTELF